MSSDQFAAIEAQTAYLRRLAKEDGARGEASHATDLAQARLLAMVRVMVAKSVRAIRDDCADVCDGIAQMADCTDAERGADACADAIRAGGKG